MSAQQYDERADDEAAEDGEQRTLEGASEIGRLGDWAIGSLSHWVILWGVIDVCLPQVLLVGQDIFCLGVEAFRVLIDDFDILSFL